MLLFLCSRTVSVTLTTRGLQRIAAAAAISLGALGCLVLAPSAGAVIEGTPVEASTSGQAVLLSPPLSVGYRSESAARRNVRDSTRALCTATMITSSWLVTAAHCVLGDQDLERPTVVIGKTDLRQPDNATVARRRSQVVIVNGEYVRRASIESDIALIKLDRPVKNATVLPMAAAGYVPAAEAPVLVRGWGANKSGSMRGMSPILRQGVLTVASDQASTDRLGMDYIPGRVIGTNPTDEGIGNVCFGDSGGPMIDVSSGTEVLVGVTSFAEDGDCLQSSGFTSIAAYRAWIERAQKLRPVVESRTRVVIEATQDGRQLSCLTGFDNVYRGSTVSTRYVWSVNGVRANGNSNLLPLRNDYFGKKVTCQATLQMPGGTATSLSRPMVPR